jgi:type III secretion system FlhB-like substrate exporter
MISSDLAARLRAMTEDAVQPLAPVRGVPADLPDFRSGNRFTATIQSILPDGTFKAEVAGKTVTLAMPHGAKAGDSLELVVIDRTARAIVANRADAPPQPGALQPSLSTTLSRGAQVIGTLLAQSGEASDQAAALTRNQPITPAPPNSGRALAPLLQTAIAESGVFYEAHQALWITGKWPLRALLREPQGQHSSAQAPPENAGERSANTMNTGSPPSSSTGVSTPLLVRTALGELALQAPPAEMPRGIAAGKPTVPNLPADLGPVVRQQLDALSSDHVVWQGQIWPGQNMEWEIEDATHEAATEETQEPKTWTTTVRLSLPHLGTVAATLKLNGTGVTMAMRATERSSVDALRNAIADLAGALDAVGVPLSYEKGAAAPRVVAKGRGLIADEIIARARDAGVFVHESPELVGLLMQVDLDAHIPPQLYVAVAELLAWIYRLEQGGSAPVPTPETERKSA